MSEQLFQLGIKGLIRNDQGNILLVHAKGSNGKPDYWDLPGGRMEPGETFLDTLKRELIEEIGIPFTGTPQLLTAVMTNVRVPVESTTVPLVLIVFSAKLEDPTKIKLDPESVEYEYKWFSPKVAVNKINVKFPAEFRQLISSL